MIRVTKLKGEVFYVNPFEIEFIEETPDTVLSLKSGRKVLVTESAETVIGKMVAFYRTAMEGVHAPEAVRMAGLVSLGTQDEPEKPGTPADR